MELKNYPKLVEFLEETQATTIAVPIDGEGTIHAASLVYWNSVEPLEFYFVTSRETEKYTLLKEQDSINCAAVVGTERGTPFTLQMRGQLREVDPEDYREEVESYYQKRGDRHDYIGNSSSCLLQFTPNWARFIDYSKGWDTQFLDLDDS